MTASPNTHTLPQRVTVPLTCLSFVELAESWVSIKEKKRGRGGRQTKATAAGVPGGAAQPLLSPAPLCIMRVLGLALLFCVAVAVKGKITRESVGDNQLRARGALYASLAGKTPAEKNFDTVLREHQIECQVSGGDHLLVLRILKASHLDTSVWTFGLPSPFVRARVRCPETAGAASGKGKTIDRCGEEDPVQTNTKAKTVNPVFGVATRSNEEFICVPAGTYDKASLELEVVAEGNWVYNERSMGIGTFPVANVKPTTTARGHWTKAAVPLQRNSKAGGTVSVAVSAYNLGAIQSKREEVQCSAITDPHMGKRQGGVQTCSMVNYKVATGLTAATKRTFFDMDSTAKSQWMNWFDNADRSMLKEMNAENSRKCQAAAINYFCSQQFQRCEASTHARRVQALRRHVHGVLPGLLHAGLGGRVRRQNVCAPGKERQEVLGTSFEPVEEGQAHAKGAGDAGGCVQERDRH